MLQAALEAIEERLSALGFQDGDNGELDRQELIEAIEECRCMAVEALGIESTVPEIEEEEDLV